MSKKPMSWYTNRIGLGIILVFFAYQLQWGFRNNEALGEWVILSVIGSIATLVASPNKALDLGKKKVDNDDSDS